MSVKSQIKQVPVIMDVYTRYRQRDLLKCEKHVQGKPIREAILKLQRPISAADRARIVALEAEREKLLAMDEALVDGSLGEEGLYDKNQSVLDVCKVSKSPEAALLLYLLAKEVKPAKVIELGTNVGISASYIAAGQKAGKHGGQVVTLDASAYRQRLAKKIHANNKLDNISYVQGLFTETLRPTLAEMGSVDLAFIDGHHQYQPTLDYFEEILKFSTPDTVFVFDDINWSDGMKKAWAELRADKRLGLVIDLNSVGIATLQRKGETSRFVSEPIRFF